MYPMRTLKYSDSASCWAALSFERIADMPPRACEDFPCKTLLKAASLSLSSLSSVDILEVFESTVCRDAVAMLKGKKGSVERG